MPAEASRAVVLEHTKSRQFIVFTVALIVPWTFIIAAHVTAVVSDRIYPENRGSLQFWKMHTELGMVQLFEALMLTVALLFIIRMAIACKSPILLLVAILYVWVEADNLFSWHERMGQQIARLAHVGKNLSEALAFLPFALCLIAVTCFAVMTRPRNVVAVTLVGLIWVLGLFAVGVDFVAGLIHIKDRSFLVQAAMAFLEEGGETFTIILACAFAQTASARTA